MELIPILSTIVLVATISTFLLAIGAYLLFKIRERKGVHIYPKLPSYVEAELVTPVEVKEEIKPVETGGSDDAKKSIETCVTNKHDIEEKEKQKEVKFQEYKKEETERKEALTGEKKGIEEKKEEDTKFLKYTSEGYIPPKEDKNTGAMRWR